ncbi:coiled-coil domain-containing protein 169-like [Oscarella lobularis]|uniref:coiled-coil domain-containing protein 169-like n=1 Tax=Oscarella lobularis TaxID=121494 RepID=UPI0033137A50
MSAYFSPSERRVARIKEEKKLNDEMRASVSQLEVTIKELEESLSKVHMEECDWQQRYEVQHEKNRQLETELKRLESELQAVKEGRIDPQAPVEDSYEDLSQVDLKMLLKKLESEKAALERDLSTYEWRLNKESRLYYKAEEDRKTYLSELSHAQLLLNDGKRHTLQKKRQEKEKKISLQLQEAQKSPKSDRKQYGVTKESPLAKRE